MSDRTGQPGPAVGVDASQCPTSHSVGNRLARVLWGVVYALLFRPSPKVLHPWRRWLLRRFGARIGRGAVVHPSVRIWGPWNLTMGEYACLAPRVDCYCVDRVEVGPHATVSQYTYLCTASHDYRDPYMALITAPIRIGAQAWLCADVFVAPGVTVGDGAVAGARASVFADVPAWTVVAGNPARYIKDRVLRRPAEGKAA